MKTLPPDGAFDIQDEQGSEARFVEQKPDIGLLHPDALRSWLVSGVHVVDPRRRFGRHGRTRELLVVDGSLRPGASERWQMLAAALHRHSVRGGLSELSSEERRVITLAYLEGRTNREIAATLGVSVATVRRRLWVALEHLDAYLRRTGAWLSAFILAVVTYAVVHVTWLGRSVSAAAGSTDKAQRLVATLTAGALTATALGMVALTADSAIPGKSATARAVPLTFEITAGAQPSNPFGSQTVPPSPARTDGVPLGAAAIIRGSEGMSPTPAGHPNNGCDGNPTSAPAPVPVGSPSSHPTGAPVTHPTAGGCKG